MSARYDVISIPLSAYQSFWRDNQSTLNWHCLFVTPPWLEPVVARLGTRGDPLILVVKEQHRVVGVAPMAVSGKKAFFLGRSDVCDYQDIVSATGREADVMQALIDYMDHSGVYTLDLETVRPDASVFKGLETLVVRDRVELKRHDLDVTFEMPLPASWEHYLMQLNAKQRHEVRRKVRRLNAAEDGPYAYRQAMRGPSLQADIAAFLNLFQKNRQDKAAFMTGAMADYFSDLLAAMAANDLLRLNFLELSGTPAAAVVCFDFGRTRYLYNSAYDARYHHLSVGILSKVFSIRSAIDAGIRHYDFLKGAETYKKRIGGQQVRLYRCAVRW